MLTRFILPSLPRSIRSVSQNAPSSAKVSSVTSKSESQTPTVNQAPNYPTTWTTSQRPRPAPRSSPRFEQTAMDLQPQPLSAMELISQEPIRLVNGRKAVCDGGGGPLGHPKIYVNLDKPGPRPCGYCGIRFEQAPHHH
ncbi:ubiquinone oxidoreductase 20 kd subunit [Cyathus striatus]|nr:ubiquinone oxidoreductase 20 kd subunit [Cyathus striatus]